MTASKPSDLRHTLDDQAAERLLLEVGVPLVEQRHLEPDGDLTAAAADLGYPVVLKARAAGLVHRTEAQAVALGLYDPAAVERAGAAMRASLGARLDGFLLQRQAPQGPELLVGYVRDPVFGPAVMVGMGGIQAELDPDVAMRLWPCSDADLASMLDELRARRLFDGFRGSSPIDRAAVVALARSLGRLGESHPGVWEVDLNPVIARPEGLVAVDSLVRVGDPPPPDEILRTLEERLQEMTRFFQPRGLAVMGASRHPLKAGNVILRNLQRLGFQGAIYPVNPTMEEVLGLRCYPSAAAIEGPVDLAVVVVPREAVLPVLEDCGQAGIPNVIVSTAGFSDDGPEGKRLQDELVARSGELGIRLMGPNSIGTVEVQAGLVTSLASIEPVPAGAAAYFGQTGLFASAFPRWLAASGRQGAKCLASLGNKADVDEACVLELVTEDPGVKAVGMYLEGVRHGRRLFDAMRRATERKPVVVVKSGRTALGAAAAASHTGALATDDRIADAAFRQAGVIRVDDFPTMFDQVRAFEMLPLPRGRRLGVVSITGVGCVLAADACGQHGFELPPLSPGTEAQVRKLSPHWAPISNPLDMWSTIEQVGPADAYRHLATAVLSDPQVDALLLIFVHIPESTIDARVVFRDVIEQAQGRPVLGAVFGGEPALETFRRDMEEMGIPVFDDPERAVQVLGGLVRYAEHLAVAV